MSNLIRAVVASFRDNCAGNTAGSRAKLSKQKQHEQFLQVRPSKLLRLGLRLLVVEVCAMDPSNATDSTKAMDTTRTLSISYDARRRLSRRLLLYRMSTTEKLCVRHFRSLSSRMDSKNVFVKAKSNCVSLESVSALKSILGTLERRLQTPQLVLKLGKRLELIQKRYKEDKPDKNGQRSTRDKENDGEHQDSTLCAVSKMNVFRLVRFSAFQVLPRSLLGSSNLNRLLSNFKMVIGAGKGSHLCLGSLMVGIKPQIVPWMPLEMSQGDQFHLLAKIVLWVCEDFLWQVVLAFFQLSETSHGRNELSFYRKRNFQAFYHSTVAKMESCKQLKRLSASKLASLSNHSSSPGLTDCRLLPKRRGSRIIARERNKSPNESGQGRLTGARLLLVYLKKKYKESVDSCGRDLFRVWSKFVEQNEQKQVYAVFVDVKDAYDSIQLSKLSSILIVLAEDVRSSSLCLVSRLCKSGRRRFMTVEHQRKVRQSDRLLSTEIDETLLTDVIQRCHRQVLCFTEGRKSASFVRRRGIPQGDVLSSALCNIYYGTMVKEEIWPKLSANNESILLMRAVDDFVFASTNKKEAEKFLCIMTKGFDAYGCQIQSRKTVLNFKLNHNNANLKFLSNMSDEISFCGAIINMRTKEIRPDFSSYFDQNIAFAAKLNCPETTPFKQFILTRMLFLSTLKLHSCFLHEGFNSLATTRKNFFEIVFVLALRFHALVSSLMVVPESVVELTDPPMAHFVIKVILSCLGKIRVHVKNLRKNNKKFLSTLSDIELRFLIFEAFKRVLQARSAFYGAHCIKELKRHVAKVSVERRLKMWCDEAIEERETTRISSQPVFKLK